MHSELFTYSLSLSNLKSVSVRTLRSLYSYNIYNLYISYSHSDIYTNSTSIKYMYLQKYDIDMMYVREWYIRDVIISLLSFI